jgi:hypothetical protein
MVLDVNQDLFAEDYSRWHFFDVSALKPGPWMAKINDLAGQLRVADGQ